MAKVNDLIAAGSRKGKHKMTMPDQLRRRLEARIIRHRAHNFVGDDLTEKPSDEVVADGNRAIHLVFGERGGQWNETQYRAWAWPNVPLVGDNKAHFSGGPLAQYTSSTQRLIDLVLLSVDEKAEVFGEFFGVPSRLKELQV